jgi:hypothetical protein
VTHQDHGAGIALQNMPYCGQRSHNPLVAGDGTVIQRHVEINSEKSRLISLIWEFV